MFIDNLENLFRYVLERERTLVYGDLGRQPHAVVQYLATHYSHLNVLFVSIHYPLSIPNHVQQFREISHNKTNNYKCDLLVLLEPPDHTLFQANYPGAASVVLFTSHAILDVKNCDLLGIAIYFHSEQHVGDRIRQLMAKREGSEENEDVQIAKNHVAHPSVLTIGPGKHCDVVLSSGKPVPPLMPTTTAANNYFVVVDLTAAAKQQPLSIFLCYLDAFDYMAENLDRVERWSVCFAPHGTRKYENFVQECIDRLHCSQSFRPYLRRLLPLLPFYVSGTLDPSFDVPVSRFMRHEYVAPDSLEEAFKTVIAYDTQQLVGGVLSIVK